MDIQGHGCAACAHFQKTVTYPVELCASLKGRYFTAQTPCLHVGCEGNAWGALINPRGSDVNLNFFVSTLNYIEGGDLTISFYMNADLPGCPREAPDPEPANTAIHPLPQAQTELLYASGVSGFPEDGQFMFSRTAYANQFLTIDGDGRFIVPPGGNICFFLSPLTRAQAESKVYLAYGFWEEPIA